MSGPTSRVVTWSITAKTIAWAVLVVTLFLFGLGSFFNWLGLRVAIEYAPQLAQQVGGVTSQVEFDRFQQSQHAKIEALEQRLAYLGEQMQELEKAKQGLFDRLGLARRLTGREGTGGRGGPMQFVVPVFGRTSVDAALRLDSAMQEAQSIETNLTQVQQRWQADLLRLDQVPSDLPLQVDFKITSELGYRLDPFTRWPSIHDGLDFVAPVGTPVHATAKGRVITSEFTSAYGQWVEIEHADGFVTRYAHLQNRKVQEGDWLERGDVLGWLGNTGRSTGPHLHYEVRYQGRPMHPVQALTVWSRRAQ